MMPLTKRLILYAHSMRLHQPIGIYLLLWPTYWALWLANQQMPPAYLLFIFTAGVILMRSAGCIINDIADRHIDCCVERTKGRPLASNQITLGESCGLTMVILLLSLFLLATLPPLTWILALIALLCTIIYPYTKRFFCAPQICLGFTFCLNIPIAFAAIRHTIPTIAWLLFVANLLWVIAYDTQYAMTDKIDDLKLNLKSTAIAWGHYDVMAIVLLQTLFLLIMGGIGLYLTFNRFYWLALSGTLCLFIYQYSLTRYHNPPQCFLAFLTNRHIGLMIFVGIFLQYR